MHHRHVQRLGYLLVLVEQEDLAGRLDSVPAERNAFTVALAPWLDMAGTPRDSRWQLALNTEVSQTYDPRAGHRRVAS